MDGSSVETILTDLEGPSGITLDALGDKMYWTDPVSEAIYRANLDGTGVTDLIVGLSGPFGFAIDLASDNGQPIPEPTSMLLLASGIIGLVGFRRKMKNSRFH